MNKKKKYYISVYEWGGYDYIQKMLFGPFLDHSKAETALAAISANIPMVYKAKALIVTEDDLERRID